MSALSFVFLLSDGDGTFFADVTWYGSDCLCFCLGLGKFRVERATEEEELNGLGSGGVLDHLMFDGSYRGELIVVSSVERTLSAGG